MKNYTRQKLNQVIHIAVMIFDLLSSQCISEMGKLK
jgi:hypothetical protein